MLSLCKNQLAANEFKIKSFLKTNVKKDSPIKSSSIKYDKQSHEKLNLFLLT